MRNSKEIQAEIDKLCLELKEAKLKESKEILWNNHSSDEMIGFCDIKKAKIILTALNNGERLLIEHEALGNYFVWMNPQRNRILVRNVIFDKKKEICEDDIMKFIVIYSGIWYIVNDDYEPILS
jgi:hypothetical protein